MCSVLIELENDGTNILHMFKCNSDELSFIERKKREWVERRGKKWEFLAFRFSIKSTQYSFYVWHISAFGASINRFLSQIFFVIDYDYQDIVISYIKYCMLNMKKYSPGITHAKWKKKENVII